MEYNNLRFIKYSQKVYSKLKENFVIRPSDFDIINLKINSPEGSIPMRIYYPKNTIKCDENSCIFFMHGGGFVMGNLDTHEGICLKLARKTGRVIVSIDYRLAPKHIYPAAIRDCYCAYYYICKNHKALKINLNDISLCGTSAGGNLALSVMEMSLRRKKRGVIPSSVVLMYPVTDIESMLMEEYLPSYLENANEVNLPLDTMKSMLRYYIPYFDRNTRIKDKNLLGNPYISPVKSELIFHYPKVLVISAGRDILRDENRNFVEVLAQNAVEFEHHEFVKKQHAFMSFESKDTENAIRIIADFLE